MTQKFSNWDSPFCRRIAGYERFLERQSIISSHKDSLLRASFPELNVYMVQLSCRRISPPSRKSTENNRNQMPRTCQNGEKQKQHCGAGLVKTNIIYVFIRPSQPTTFGAIFCDTARMHHRGRAYLWRHSWGGFYLYLACGAPPTVFAMMRRLPRVRWFSMLSITDQMRWSIFLCWSQKDMDMMEKVSVVESISHFDLGQIVRNRYKNDLLE